MIREKNSLIHRWRSSLEKGGLMDYEKRAKQMVIESSKIYIDNIDEVTIIEIGSVTNSLIEAIKKAYQYHLVEYWQNFEKFMEKYIIGLTPDGKLKAGSFFGQSQCYELGVGLKELSICFKGKNPMTAETGDLFRKLINTNYGTNIPLTGVEEAALKEYESVAFGTDTDKKDQAFICLKEIQRDAGALKNGGDYYILATNQNYQEAKARCSGRSI